MDKSACKAIIDREIEPLMGRLGIPHWRVSVSYGHVEGSEPGFTAHAEVNRNSDYNQAHVTVNADEVADEPHLLKLLRHELFHVLLSPFDLAERVTWAVVEGDPIKDKMLQAVVKHAHEQAVINLERMYQGLTLPSQRSETP